MMVGDEADQAEAAAADFIVSANRRSQAQFRHLRQHPFGFAPGSPRPVPATVSSETGRLALSGIARAILTLSPLPRSSMSLLHGNYSDLSATLIEIITDFSRGHEDSDPVEYELGRADHRDSAIARGEEHVEDPDDVPSGPFGHGSVDIFVESERRTVPVLIYRRCRAFRFEHKRMLVTVVTRNEIPELPAFAPIANLETYVTKQVIDREATRNWLRDRRDD
jgi:hypothetical protein